MQRLAVESDFVQGIIQTGERLSNPLLRRRLAQLDMNRIAAQLAFQLLRRPLRDYPPLVDDRHAVRQAVRLLR